MKSQKGIIKTLMIGFCFMFILQFAFLGINPVFATPLEEFGTPIGSWARLNITESVDPSQPINSSVYIECINVNNSIEEFWSKNRSGSYIWLKIMEWNETGNLTREVSNWSLFYNESDSDFDFVGGLMVGGDDPFFNTFGSNFTKWGYLMSLLVLNFDYPLNVSDYSEEWNFTAWRGFNNGSGENSSSMRIELNYNATTKLMNKYQISGWNETSFEWDLWVLGLEVESYSPPITPTPSEPLNPVVLIGIYVVSFVSLIAILYGITEDQKFNWR